MAQCNNCVAGDVFATEQSWKEQINDVGVARTNAAGGTEDGNDAGSVVDIGHKQKVAGFNWRAVVFDAPASKPDRAWRYVIAIHDRRFARNDDQLGTSFKRGSNSRTTASSAIAT